MDSNEILIGTGNYSVPRIVALLSTSNNSSYTKSNLQKLFSLLEIHQDTREKIEGDMETPKVTLDEVLFTVLFEWRNRNPSQATVTNLITILRKCDFNHSADILQNKLCNTTNSLSQSGNLNLNPQASLSTTSADQQTSLALDSSSIENIKHEMFQLLEEKQKKLSKPLLRSLSLAFVVGVVVLMICIILIFLLLIPLPSRDQFYSRIPLNTSTTLPVNSTEEEEIIPNPVVVNDNYKNPNDAYTRKQCRNLVVSTFLELQERLSDLSTEKVVCIHIRINDCGTWSTSIGPSFRQIVFLVITGCVSPTSITAILPLLPDLQSLNILKTKEHDQCINSPTQQILVSNSRKIQLNRLTSLTVQNFGNCSEVLNTLATRFLTPNVKALTISNSSNIYNVSSVIRPLLKNIRYSVTHLTIPYANYEPPIFENMTFLLSKVVYLNITFQKVQEQSFDCLGTNAQNVLPNLKVLIVSWGTVSWQQYLQILKFENLQELEIGIFVPQNEIFSLDVLTSSLIHLRKAKLTLEYSSPETCKIRDKRLLKTFAKIDIHANCILKYD